MKTILAKTLTAAKVAALFLLAGLAGYLGLGVLMGELMADDD